MPNGRYPGHLFDLPKFWDGTAYLSNCTEYSLRSVGLPWFGYTSDAFLWLGLFVIFCFSVFIRCSTTSLSSVLSSPQSSFVAACLWILSYSSIACWNRLDPAGRDARWMLAMACSISVMYTGCAWRKNLSSSTSWSNCWQCFFRVSSFTNVVSVCSRSNPNSKAMLCNSIVKIQSKFWLAHNMF